jgi:hypothetical protein
LRPLANEQRVLRADVHSESIGLPVSTTADVMSRGEYASGARTAQSSFIAVAPACEEAFSYYSRHVDLAAALRRSGRRWSMIDAKNASAALPGDCRGRPGEFDDVADLSGSAGNGGRFLLPAFGCGRVVSTIRHLNSI